MIQTVMFSCVISLLHRLQQFRLWLMGQYALVCPQASGKRWISAYNNDAELCVVRELASNPSLVSNKRLSEVNHNYPRSLRLSQISIINKMYELALRVRAYPQILSKYLSVRSSVACVPLQIILGTVFRLIFCSVVCETA